MNFINNKMKKNISKKNNSRKSLIEKRLKYLEENEHKASELHIILSCMFGGKTSHLLSVIESAGRVEPVLYINHLSDTLRSGANAISTHSKSRDIPKLVSEMNGEAVKLEKLKDYPLKRLINIDGSLKFSCICLDEIQFFKDLEPMVKFYVDVLNVPYVYCAGLDGDSNRKNFGKVHKLIPIANSYTKLLNARCEMCAKSKKYEHALFTHKFAGNSKNTIDVGGDDKYEPLCRKCWNLLNKN